MRYFGRLNYAITATVIGLLSASAWPNMAAAEQPRPCSDYDQDFALYFESDRATPSQTGIMVLEQALNNLKDAHYCQISAVIVTGHQDRAGSREYNEALSMAMAFGIADELMARGIPLEKIQRLSRGESQMATPTPDGAREPLNRRVEIQISMRTK